MQVSSAAKKQLGPGERIVKTDPFSIAAWTTASGRSGPHSCIQVRMPAGRATTASLALMAACLSIGRVALAQQAPQAPSDASTPTLEEVVVTARKRSEDLQRTPVSVTAISATEADQENIRDFQGLAGF